MQNPRDQSSEGEATVNYPVSFWIGNGFLAVFFYTTWLLSFWAPAIAHWQDGISDVQRMAVGFVSFFIASFIPLRFSRNKLPMLKSIGFASLFWMLLFGLICISILALVGLP